MSDQGGTAGRAVQRSGEDKTKSNVTIIYALLLAGIVFPVVSLIAVIMAYVYRGDAGALGRSHYTFQIRTFWITLLVSIVGGLLTLIVVGWLVLLVLVVWFIVRCVKGLQAIQADRPIENPETWGVE